MMDGEEVYRQRLADALTAADRETLEHAKKKHLIAAAAWQTLLDLEVDRKTESDRPFSPQKRI